jgi:hypothetical protein
MFQNAADDGVGVEEEVKDILPATEDILALS